MGANLGVQVSLSHLKNLANSNTSSLIKVSTVCLLPTLILGTSTVRSKNLPKSSASSLVSNSHR